MYEYVKYNCHVMQKNDVGSETPEKIFQTYLRNRRKGVDYVFQNTDCVVISVTWAANRKRKDSLPNEEIICTEQES